jgi:hypothetical protein
MDCHVRQLHTSVLPNPRRRQIRNKQMRYFQQGGFLLSTIVVCEQKLKQGLERGPTLLVQPWPEVHWHEGSYLCPFSGSIVTCR